MPDEKKRRLPAALPPRRIGRHPLPGPRRRDTKLYLPEEALTRLRAIGRGSASEGVLITLAVYEQQEADNGE